MKRRKFIFNTSVSFAGFQLLNSSDNFPLSLFTKHKDSENLFSPLDFNEISITELQELMNSGKLSSEQLSTWYLKRISEIDKNGPEINAIIELNPDAISIAKQMDEERKTGKLRSMMHGIPVLLKDNIDTADQMMTTAGSLALLNHKAANDAFIVKKLREQGAVILGKTNLSEWANFRSTRSVSGWSSRGGQTKNPYVLDRSPCGSSSGSAAAVAANLCTVAIGTETDGSIACPASMNSLVGIKPTIGLVSRTGIIPISKTQDTAGPMARNVTDAVILLNAIVGVDQNDTVTNESKLQTIPDYTNFLDTNGLNGKRIGVEKSFLKKHEAVDGLFHAALEQMKSKGAILIELEFIEAFNKLAKDEFELMQYEFKDGLNAYLSSANAAVNSLQDVIAFNTKNAAVVMPHYQQEIMEASQMKGDLQSKEYLEMVIKYSEARKFYNAFFEQHQLDVFCGPANGFPWCIDLINGDFFTGYGVYSPAAVCGYPSITIPMGNVNDLPVGISFIGKAYHEPGLISIAYAYEQISKNRIQPKFLTTYK
jgi:amidase